MAEQWLKIELSFWADIALSLEESGNPWPKSAVIMDLRWHDFTGKKLSRTEAMGRWGWSERKARAILENKNVLNMSQSDPKKRSQVVENTDGDVQQMSQPCPAYSYIEKDKDLNYAQSAVGASDKSDLSIDNNSSECPKTKNSLRSSSKAQTKAEELEEKISLSYKAFVEINATWRKEQGVIPWKGSANPSKERRSLIKHALSLGYTVDDIVAVWKYAHYCPNMKWWAENDRLFPESLLRHDKVELHIQQAADWKAKAEPQKQAPNINDRIIKLTKVVKSGDSHWSIPEVPGIDDIDREVLREIGGWSKLCEMFSHRAHQIAPTLNQLYQQHIGV